MCVLFVAYRQHDQFPLVVAANRDEAYGRPALQAHFWEDYPNILAGRDLEQGGTWLGVTRNGKFAALTNFRNPNAPAASQKSRGWIVRDYLDTRLSAQDYLNRLQVEKHLYPGFNIVLSDAGSLWYYSNVEDKPTKLSPGVYGISNHLLDTPWPKVVRGKHALQSSLSGYIEEDVVENNLWGLLADEQQAVDSELPDTGVGLEWERTLSPIFIRSPEYGTRCSTVVMLNSNHRLSFAERTYSPMNDAKEVRFSFIAES